jgi:hypothetical protein
MHISALKQAWLTRHVHWHIRTDHKGMSADLSGTDCESMSADLSETDYAIAFVVCMSVDKSRGTLVQWDGGIWAN